MANMFYVISKQLIIYSSYVQLSIHSNIYYNDHLFVSYSISQPDSHSISIAFSNYLFIPHNSSILNQMFLALYLFSISNFSSKITFSSYNLSINNFYIEYSHYHHLYHYYCCIFLKNYISIDSQM